MVVKPIEHVGELIRGKDLKEIIVDKDNHNIRDEGLYLLKSNGEVVEID